MSTGSGNPHDVPEIVDPDVDLIEPDEPGRPARHGRVLAAIAVGGAVGAEARYGSRCSCRTRRVPGRGRRC